jgi:hypothetical protein
MLPKYFVILHCVGNYDKKKCLETSNENAIFPNIFDLQLFEPTYVDLVAMKD